MNRAPLPASADERLVAELMADVAPAEQAFTSRWRLSTLKRLDAELYERLVEQRMLYDVSLVTGTPREAREQSQAMIRGWRAACACLEAPLQPDDAYMTGSCPKTGTRVVIGDHIGSVARVQADPAHAGLNVLYVTPDEVAKMMGGLAVVSSVKAAFPDAEIVVDAYPDHAGLV